MEGLIVLGLLVVALAVFDALALRIGVDSRIESTDRHSPAHGISI